MINFKISDNTFIINEYADYIESIALFGSKARGDNDSLSDLDVFCLIANCDEETYVKIKKSIEKQLGLPAHWISIYRLSTVLSMQKKGSYFLWHLKKEGIILFSRGNILERILNTLPTYKGIKQDLEDYRVICNDIKNSIAVGDSPLQFELAILASLVRNTCIAISFQFGMFVFSREEPIKVVRGIIGQSFPFTDQEYRELYKFRISYSRKSNLNLKSVSLSYVETWIKNVEFLINFGIKYSEEGDN